jgi:hypothetical protein
LGGGRKAGANGATSSLDLRLAPEGAAPAYFWGIAVKAGETTDLGTVALKHGGSIVGFARTYRPLGTEPIRVVVSRETLTDAAGDERRMLVDERTAVVNERGFFQFTQLSSGTYTIKATKPGWSVSQLGDIRVREGTEVDVGEPIILSPLVRLDAWIIPPVDVAGKPWKLRLSKPIPLSNYSRETAERAVPADGRLEWDGLEAGRYRLELLDSAGRRNHAEDLVIDPPGLQHSIHLNLVRVRGTVKTGKDALAGSVIFLHDDGSSLRFATEEDGRFDAVLPRPGDWRRAVKSPESCSGGPAIPSPARKSIASCPAVGRWGETRQARMERSRCAWKRPRRACRSWPFIRRRRP